MELGDLITKTIEAIKDNVKDPNSIGGNTSTIELDIIIEPKEDKIHVPGHSASQHVSRIKIPLYVRTLSN